MKLNFYFSSLDCMSYQHSFDLSNLIYKMFYLHLTSFILYSIRAYEIYSNIIIVLCRITKWYNLIHPLGKNMRRYINLILYHNIEKIPIQILWHGLSQNYFFFSHIWHLLNSPVEFYMNENFFDSESNIGNVKKSYILLFWPFMISNALNKTKNQYFHILTLIGFSDKR